MPTFIERGFPDVEFYIWAGVWPPPPPPAIQERIRAAIAEAMASEELGRRALLAAGSQPDHRDGEAFRRFFAADSARLVAAVRRIGRVE